LAYFYLFNGLGKMRHSMTGSEMV